MASNETPEMIARTRMVSAEAVLANRVDLRSYPYRLLTIHCQNGIGPERVTYAVAAAEVLAGYRWEIASFAEFGQSRVVYVVMQRR